MKNSPLWWSPGVNTKWEPSCRDCRLESPRTWRDLWIASICQRWVSHLLASASGREAGWVTVAAAAAERRWLTLKETPCTSTRTKTKLSLCYTHTNTHTHTRLELWGDWWAKTVGFSWSRISILQSIHLVSQQGHRSIPRPGRLMCGFCMFSPCRQSDCTERYCTWKKWLRVRHALSKNYYFCLVHIL